MHCANSRVLEFLTIGKEVELNVVMWKGSVKEKNELDCRLCPKKCFI